MNKPSKIPLSEIAQLLSLQAEAFKTKNIYPEQRIVEILYFCRALAEECSFEQYDFAGRRLFDQYMKAAEECDNAYSSSVLYLSLGLSTGARIGITAEVLAMYGLPSGMIQEAAWLALKSTESILAWNLRVNKHQSILCTASSLVKQKLRIDNVPEVSDHHRHNYHGLVDMLADIHSNNLYQFSKINRHIEITNSIHAMLNYSGYGGVTASTGVKENKVINVLSAIKSDGTAAITIADMSMEIFPSSKELALIVTTPSASLNEIIKPSIIHSRYDYDDEKAYKILEAYSSRFKVFNNNL